MGPSILAEWRQVGDGQVGDRCKSAGIGLSVGGSGPFIESGEESAQMGCCGPAAGRTERPETQWITCSRPSVPHFVETDQADGAVSDIGAVEELFDDPRLEFPHGTGAATTRSAGPRLHRWKNAVGQRTPSAPS